MGTYLKLNYKILGVPFRSVMSNYDENVWKQFCRLFPLWTGWQHSTTIGKSLPSIDVDVKL